MNSVAILVARRSLCGTTKTRYKKDDSVSRKTHLTGCVRSQSCTGEGHPYFLTSNASERQAGKNVRKVM